VIGNPNPGLPPQRARNGLAGDPGGKSCKSIFFGVEQGRGGIAESWETRNMRFQRLAYLDRLTSVAEADFFQQQYRRHECLLHPLLDTAVVELP
jgi:hypothetical protein